jgi:hypothetical protein
MVGIGKSTSLMMLLLRATIALRVRVRRLVLVLVLVDVELVDISTMLGSVKCALWNPITTGEEASGARGESILLLLLIKLLCVSLLRLCVPY